MSLSKEDAPRLPLSAMRMENVNSIFFFAVIVIHTVVHAAVRSVVHAVIHAHIQSVIRRAIHAVSAVVSATVRGTAENIVSGFVRGLASEIVELIEPRLGDGMEGRS